MRKLFAIGIALVLVILAAGIVSGAPPGKFVSEAAACDTSAAPGAWPTGGGELVVAVIDTGAGQSLRTAFFPSPNYDSFIGKDRGVVAGASKGGCGGHEVGELNFGTLNTSSGTAPGGGAIGVMSAQAPQQGQGQDKAAANENKATKPTPA